MINPKIILNETKKDLYEYEIVKVLKAKRQEQKKSLEEVSKGICSTSYLSRIENYQVKLQEPYLKMLFEKLDINYDDLKASRKKQIYLELLKKYLLNVDEGYKELLNTVAIKNHYLDIEQNLVILFDTIINDKFEEAELMMEKIDIKKINMAKCEGYFYIYLVSLYYYKIHKYPMAFFQIKSIINEEIDDEVFKYSIMNLFMKISFYLGNYYTYLNLYQKFMKESPSNYFNKEYIEHRLMNIYIESLDNERMAMNKLNELKNELNFDNNNTKNINNYYNALILLKHEHIEDAMKVIKGASLNYDICKLLIIIVVKLDDIGKVYEMLALANKYRYTRYDTLISTYLEYANLKYKRLSSTIRVYSILKNKLIMLLKNGYDQIIYDELVKEIVLFDIKYSKYKEGCNFMLKVHNGLKKSIIED